ncbi:cytochrome b/b6 domain-containing protein [Occallatibacter savannae]|uniref:cytochrome b/b6 domain-containing protein n=1 Tax=Occallatibacter savannae TaxID=1002691 RepID=UPI000D693DE7|nr:cytochrome b/b6 domain-containing protein [Occallatibacter savannae]
MATAYLVDVVFQPVTAKAEARPALVRITHWIFTLSFFGLAISGFAIVLVHPHFYWGEAGNAGTPALFSLPVHPPVLFGLPERTIVGGLSGRGRHLHFQSAWFAMLSGLVYVIFGMLSQHFRNQLVPTADQLSWRSLRTAVRDHLSLRTLRAHQSYNLVQRLTYLFVIFMLFPLATLSGFAMSPSITSVFPSLSIAFGGQQSARTIHFFLSSLLCLFVVVHVLMICLTGFEKRMRSMMASKEER